jgi:hypothetical protein
MAGSKKKKKNLRKGDGKKNGVAFSISKVGVA